MNNIARKAVLFLAGLLLFSMGIQAVLSAVVRRIHIGDFGVLNAIDGGSINAKMLICGSSRGYFHYNPEILGELTGGSCYNISFNGSGLEVQLPVLKWYLDRNAPPQILIQNIDIFGGAIDPVVYTPFKFIPYLKNKNLYQGLRRLDRRWALHRYVALTNLIYFNKAFQKKMIREFYLSYRKKSDYLIQGYYPSRYHWPDGHYEEDFLKKNADGIRYPLTQAYKDYIAELIDLCRSRGIQLIFVMAPEYMKLTALEVNRRDIVDYYRQVSKDNGLWFLDFSQSEISRDRDLFYNFTHMTYEGADRFSQELAAELKKRLEEARVAHLDRQ